MRGGGGGGGREGGLDSPSHLLYEPRFLAGSGPSNREDMRCEFYSGYMYLVFSSIWLLGIVVHLMFVNTLICL